MLLCLIINCIYIFITQTYFSDANNDFSHLKGFLAPPYIQATPNLHGPSNMTFRDFLLRNALKNFFRFRPVRRLGSEFLGKRSIKMLPSYEKENVKDRYIEDGNIKDRQIQSDQLMNLKELKDKSLDSINVKQKKKFSILPSYYENLFGNDLFEKNQHGYFPNFYKFTPKTLNRRHFGSEFLGKRFMLLSNDNINDSLFSSKTLGNENVPLEFDDLLRHEQPDLFPKRAIGREFLGKRFEDHQNMKKNIGMEFLG